MNPPLLLLLLLPLLLLHAHAALCLGRIARIVGAGQAWWAWVPLLNLLLPLKVARRSLWWSLLLLVPAVNFLVWALVWAEICDALGRRWWEGIAMSVPGVNLAVMARIAGWRWSATTASLALIAASIPPAASARARQHSERARSDIRRLADPNPGIRLAAFQALVQSRTPAQAAVSALVGRLTDPDERVRAEAASALGGLGATAPTAVRALVASLDDPSPAVRGRVASALARLPAGLREAAPAERAVPALLEAARGLGGGALPDVTIVDALASQGSATVPALIAALRDGDAGVRWHAAAALMQLGATAASATPALFEAMSDEHWVVRNAAGRALEEVAQDGDVPALAKALGDTSVETRYHAARALGRRGRAATPAIADLVRALCDDDAEVRMEAVWALGSVGTGANAAVPALIEALKDGDPQVRAVAAWGLGAVGARVPEAGSALRAALEDDDRDVRDAAARVLGRIEGGGP